jgi:hypothetical protein
MSSVTLTTSCRLWEKADWELSQSSWRVEDIVRRSANPFIGRVGCNLKKALHPSRAFTGAEPCQNACSPRFA